MTPARRLSVVAILALLLGAGLAVWMGGGGASRDPLQPPLSAPGAAREAVPPVAALPPAPRPQLPPTPATAPTAAAKLAAPAAAPSITGAPALPPDPTLGAPIALAATRLRGRVVDPSSRPLAGAAVRTLAGTSWASTP